MENDEDILMTCKETLLKEGVKNAQGTMDICIMLEIAYSLRRIAISLEAINKKLK